MSNLRVYSMSMNNGTKNAARLTGTQITKIMRAYRVTIRGVAQHMGITMSRVREVRANGVSGVHFVRDWAQGLWETRRAV